jgi:hypothetical protein
MYDNKDLSNNKLGQIYPSYENTKQIINDYMNRQTINLNK